MAQQHLFQRVITVLSTITDQPEQGDARFPLRVEHHEVLGICGLLSRTRQDPHEADLADRCIAALMRHESDRVVDAAEEIVATSHLGPTEEEILGDVTTFDGAQVEALQRIKEAWQQSQERRAGHEE